MVCKMSSVIGNRVSAVLVDLLIPWSSFWVTKFFVGSYNV